MSELNGLLSGVSAFGLLLLILWVIKLKKTLKEELVNPEIQSLKKKMEEIENEIATLKKNDADLSVKLEKQLDYYKLVDPNAPVEEEIEEEQGEENEPEQR